MCLYYLHILIYQVYVGIYSESHIAKKFQFLCKTQTSREPINSRYNHWLSFGQGKLANKKLKQKLYRFWAS